MCVQTYLVDAYGLYAASALAANTVVRSLVGAFLPFAAQPMYDALGIGWGTSVSGVHHTGVHAVSNAVLCVWGVDTEEVCAGSIS